jgi:hypothetical protein
MHYLAMNLHSNYSSWWEMGTDTFCSVLSRWSWHIFTGWLPIKKHPPLNVSRVTWSTSTGPPQGPSPPGTRAGHGNEDPTQGWALGSGNPLLPFISQITIPVLYQSLADTSKYEWKVFICDLSHILQNTRVENLVFHYRPCSESFIVLDHEISLCTETGTWLTF